MAKIGHIIEINHPFKEIDVTTNINLDYNLFKEVQESLDKEFAKDDSIGDYEITFVVDEI